jgi:3-hydroxyisobutyrate dehydrogenase-like beta-hydroxyacid dehydrogenase
MENDYAVGYIGLGNAGYPMAACLGKKGYRLIVRDADPTRGIQFVEEYPKCRVASSAADAFARCDVVITMLPNGKVVRDVVLGEQGIARHLKAGTSPWGLRKPSLNDFKVPLLLTRALRRHSTHAS